MQRWLWPPCLRSGKESQFIGEDLGTQTESVRVDFPTQTEVIDRYSQELCVASTAFLIDLCYVWLLWIIKIDCFTMYTLSLQLVRLTHVVLHAPSLAAKPQSKSAERNIPNYNASQVVRPCHRLPSSQLHDMANRALEKSAPGGFLRWYISSP